MNLRQLTLYHRNPNSKWRKFYDISFMTLGVPFLIVTSKSDNPPIKNEHYHKSTNRIPCTLTRTRSDDNAMTIQLEFKTGRDKIKSAITLMPARERVTSEVRQGPHCTALIPLRGIAIRLSRNTR